MGAHVMKYMGSKRVMLQNGLGQLLKDEADSCRRFVDLFCGAASVSWFCADKFSKPVLATDLQLYAVVLAGAVIARTRPLSSEKVRQRWLPCVSTTRESYAAWPKGRDLDQSGLNIATWRKRAQELCMAKADGAGPIWKAYGGHYFSPTQALTLDAMLEALPRNKPARTVCLAAAVIAASKCVASPGHTAQPFKATRTAGRFLREAWLRDPVCYATKALDMLCPRHATILGDATVGDANSVVTQLDEGDLVFVDPPYSGVHYSRFYHVLETMARGACGDVTGVGRYPPPTERPVSKYSRKTESRQAMSDLLTSLAHAGCRVIVTFPAGKCSNGLSGSVVANIAKKLFSVERNVVTSRFSTLGGNNSHRSARSLSREMMLLLRPK